MDRTGLDAAGAEQDQQMEDEIRRLMGDRLVALARRGPDDFLGLLEHLRPDRCNSAVEERDDIASGRPRRAPLLDHLEEPVEDLRRSVGLNAHRGSPARGRASLAERIAGQGDKGDAPSH